jgi:hypothetical protein
MDAAAKAPFVAKAAERTAAAVTGGGGGGTTSSAAAPKAKRAKAKAVETDDSEDDIEYAEEDAATEDVDVEEEEEEPKQQSRPRKVTVAEGVEDTSEWGCDRTHAVQFLLTRAGSGAYVAVRAPASVPTLEQPVALRVMPATAAEEDGDSAAALQLLHSEDMEHDYEIAAAQFKAALAERTSADSIDLDDLPADSPLGSMVILEMLRSKGGPLHEQALGRGKRNVLGCTDVLVKVPAVALSFIVQRLVTAAVQADRASRGCGADEAMAEADEEGGAEPEGELVE